MPRHNAPDECWGYVQREYFPEKQHPRVACNFCNNQWTSREKNRLVAHLSTCMDLPQELWEKYQTGRVVGGPVPKRKSVVKISDRVYFGAARRRNENQMGDGDDYSPDADADADGEVDEEMTTARQEAATQACAQWIYGCGLPLSTIQHPAFRRFMQVLNPDWTLPTREELSHGLLEEEYRGRRDVVHEYLGRTGRVRLGTDYDAPSYL